MLNPVVAILHPGEMGAAIGERLHDKQLRVVWISVDRSAETRARAAEAGLEDAGTLAEALAASTLVLSVCPPHAALDLARAVAALGFAGIYVDCNAVAPATAREAARLIEGAGGRFVDGGIIGPPPVAGARTRLYLSGDGAAQLAPVLSSGALVARALDGPVGAASALKAAYAGWNKGAIALATAMHALAVEAGVADALAEEWRDTQPDALRRLQQARNSARKAWRWIAEMEEIAASLGEADLPQGFHDGAARFYERLAGFKDAQHPPSLEEIVAALEKTRKGV